MNQSPNGTLKLADHHKMMLMVGSAISENVIEQRGYFTITTPDQAKELGFNRPQCRVVSERYPALIIPYYGPDGNLKTYCMRPDNPRVVEQRTKGKLPDGTYPNQTFKYEMIKGSGNVLDCHPAIVPHLADPTKPLVFTEGAKKADSLISHGFPAINLNGVWGWRGSNEKQGKTALPDFNDIALNDRECVLAFDSDLQTNDNVKKALRDFRYYLNTKGAIVIPVTFPANGSDKTGADDFFVSGKTAEDFDNLINHFRTFDLNLSSNTKKNWTTEQHLELFIQWKYRFTINDMNEALELNGQQMNDTWLNIFEARLKDNDVPVEHAKNSMYVMGHHHRYHPIKNYFQALKWDGNDNIGLLATFFTDKQNIFPLWLKRWLIGVVAKVFGNGKNQNFMLALDGGQGIGKSYFAHWICPLPQFFLEEPLNPQDKDSRLHLISNLIWEVGELGSVTKKTDREELKRFISMQTVTARPPYARYPITKPALASFIGTVNNEGGGFLNDPTGNRRYASCTLTSIEWGYTEIDIDQIWAHACALYQRGEPWELHGNEAKLRDEINAGYEIEEPLEDMIYENFKLDPAHGDDTDPLKDLWRMSSTQILTTLSLAADRRDLTMRVAAVLKRKGLEKRRLRDENGERSYFWLGIQLK